MTRSRRRELTYLEALNLMTTTSSSTSGSINIGSGGGGTTGSGLSAFISIMKAVPGSLSGGAAVKWDASGTSIANTAKGITHANGVFTLPFVGVYVVEQVYVGATSNLMFAIFVNGVQLGNAVAAPGQLSCRFRTSAAGETVEIRNTATTSATVGTGDFNAYISIRYDGSLA
jgi:hypothetical protein